MAVEHRFVKFAVQDKKTRLYLDIDGGYVDSPLEATWFRSVEDAQSWVDNADGPMRVVKLEGKLKETNIRRDTSREPEIFYFKTTLQSSDDGKNWKDCREIIGGINE
jgi:hypothetical protein